MLRIEPASAGVARADYVFLAVPSSGLGEVIASLGAGGLGRRTAVVSVAKGLYHWAQVTGFVGGEDDAFENQSMAWQSATVARRNRSSRRNSNPRSC